MQFSFGSAPDKALLEVVRGYQVSLELTPSGEIVAANDCLLNLLGYSAEALRGQRHATLCPEPQAGAGSQAFLQEVCRAARSDVFPLRTKGAQIVWVAGTYAPVRDKSGKVTAIFLVGTPITEVKTRALDDARTVEALNRVQAIIEFDPDGTILTANDNFLKTLDYALGDIVGKHHRIFCDTAYVRSEAYQVFWRELSQGKFQAGEFQRVSRTGQPVYIQASYNPVFDENGAVIKIVKFAIDVTETVRRRMRNDTISHEINQELGGVVTRIVEATHMTGGAAAASSETAAIINSVAAASEELTQSVREIAASMSHAKSGAEEVFRHTEIADASAKTLNETAGSLTEIVALIQGIASQINLLALNAAIESARAGEAGRGFAVVATEVKTLANRAAASTRTINDEITRMQAMSQDVVAALGQVTGSMTGVVENVAGVASAIEQQYAVTGEISNNMQSAVGAVSQIEESLGFISTTFTSVASASEQVKVNVEQLVA